MYADSITSLLMPDYNKLFSISSGYKTVSDSLIWVYGSPDRGQVNLSITYSGQTQSIPFMYDSGDGQSSGSVQVYVRKDSTVSWGPAFGSWCIPLVKPD